MDKLWQRDGSWQVQQSPESFGGPTNRGAAVSDGSGVERSLLAAHRFLRRGPVSESTFYLHPNVARVGAAPLVYQLHAIIAWLFWASFPFSRLVHAWSIPLQYIGRPYILYRRRYSTAR